LKALIKLDYETLEGLVEGDEGHPEQWAPIFMNHPTTWRMLLSSDNAIRGYWHFAPLFPDDYARAGEGKLLDSEITADRIPEFSQPGQYDVYFVQICLLPRFRQIAHKRLLLTSVVDVLEELAAADIYVRHVTANAYTAVGEAMCGSFGLTEHGPHVSHGKLFMGPIADVLRSPLARSRPELLAAYGNAGLT
jgi:hypothetical protein